MITAKNLSSANIDFSKLPAKFKEDYGDIVEMVPYIDQEPDFKQVVNSYVAGLNKELSKAKPKAKAKKQTTDVNRELPEGAIILDSFSVGATIRGPKSGAEIILTKKKGDTGHFYPISYVTNEGKHSFIAQGWTESEGRELFAKQKKDFAELNEKHKPAAKKPRQSSAAKTKKAAEIAAAKGRLNSMLFDAKKGNYQHLNRSQVLEMAQVFQSDRIKSAATLDGKMDSKKRLTPTPENLVRWMKEPGKFDLIGVDTFEKNNPTADLKIKKEIFWHRLLKK
jgi:hypothetical protein